jgi:hypothetical protein
MAWSGRLPNIGTYDFAPYSRVYSKSGNSITNRFGWFSPRFALKEGSHRIAVIGDSYLHAPDTQPDQHLGTVLQNLLGSTDRTEVLELGISGTGPAYYLEMLRYAKTYLKADEAVIFVTTVNDFMNSDLALNNPAWFTPTIYIYYTEAPDGRITMDPRSQPALYRLTREFELTHRSVWLNLARTIRSHILIEKCLKYPLERWRQIRSLRAETAAGSAATATSGQDIEIPMGGDKGPYLDPMAPEVKRSVDIGLGVLRMCNEYAKSHGMKLRLVTIPQFPPKFYQTYEASDTKDWSLKFGNVDLFRPEKIVLDFARTEGIPALSLGLYIRQKGLTARQIKPLFFDGFGHFTPAGHRFFGEALYESFFRSH